MGNSNKKKLLFIHHGRGIGGAPKSLSLITNNLDFSKYEVVLIFLTESPAKDLFEKYTSVEVIHQKIFYFNHTSTWVKISDLHIGILQLVSWIKVRFFIAPKIYKKYNPDLVYLNSSVLSDWLVAAKKLNIKTIMHVRESVSNGYFGIRKLMLKMIINKYADKIIYISKHNADILDTEPDKSMIIYNSVLAEAEYSTYPKTYDLIYLGGDKKIKGFDLLKQSLPFLKDKKICILGHYSSDNVDLFKSYDNIDFVSFTTNSELYIAQSRILLFPATTPHFPRPVIEAMMLNTLCISSNLPGISEIIDESVNGFLFKNMDLESFLTTIEKVYNLNSSKRNDVLSCARVFAESKFCLKSNNERIFQLIHETIMNN